MSDNNALYSAFERSREAVWAHREDSKALEGLRRRMEAEADMTSNVAQLKKKAPRA